MLSFLVDGVVPFLRLAAAPLFSRPVQLVLAALLIFWMGERHADNLWEGKLAAQKIDYERKLAVETQRRAFAIQMAAQQARSDTDQIQRLEAQLQSVQKEIDHASHAHDRRPGLPADSVRRLNQLR